MNAIYEIAPSKAGLPGMAIGSWSTRCYARSRPLRCLSVLAAAALIGGCETHSSRERPGTVQGFAVYDSAGLRVLETQASAVAAPLPWRISDAPVLELGARDGPSQLILHRVHGAARLADGRVLVADGATRELRMFDRDGAFLGRFGGAGEGPGRFRGSPQLVPASAADSILVFDASLQRFSVFSLDGALRETHRSLVVGPSFVAVPWGSVPLRRVDRAVGVVGERVAVSRTVGLIGGSAGPMQPEPVEFLLLDPATGDSRRIGTFDGKQNYNTERDPLGQMGTHPMPFDSKPTAAAAGAFLYLALGPQPEVRVYDDTAALVKLLRVDLAARSVTERDRSLFVDEYVRRNPRAESTIRRVYQEVPFPEVMPALQSVIVDELGWVWAEVFRSTPEAPAAWWVFDPEGRGRGTVATPGDLEVIQIGADFILGTWRDELGVEYVRVYDLHRLRSDGERSGP